MSFSAGGWSLLSTLKVPVEWNVGVISARHFGIFRIRVLQALSSGIEGQIPENGAVLHDVKLSMTTIAIL